MSEIETPDGPTVSVLMTSYNREKYIAAAIESVLAQTYRDFELLIVDDCSTDGTVAIAERYAALDSRIRVFRNERNLGQFPNRNHAASLARGRYLKYADSDDILYPYCLEVLVTLLDAEPRADFALSVTGSWYSGPAPAFFTPQMCYQREFLGVGGLLGACPSASLYRADRFHRLGGFPNKGIASDALFLLHACLESSVVIAPGELFWYRSHPSQDFQSARAAHDYLLELSERWKLLESDRCPLTPAERRLAKELHAGRYLRLAVRNVVGGKLRTAFQLLKYAGPLGAEWLRYARRRRRDLFAGAARDADGEFVVPMWPETSFRGLPQHSGICRSVSATTVHANDADRADGCTALAMTSRH